jgi:hypothetical protein
MHRDKLKINWQRVGIGDTKGFGSGDPQQGVAGKHRADAAVVRLSGDLVEQFGRVDHRDHQRVGSDAGERAVVGAAAAAEAPPRPIGRDGGYQHDVGLGQRGLGVAVDRPKHQVTVGLQDRQQDLNAAAPQLVQRDADVGLTRKCRVAGDDPGGRHFRDRQQRRAPPRVRTRVGGSATALGQQRLPQFVFPGLRTWRTRRIVGCCTHAE